MQLGVPKESITKEARVAATPKTVEQLVKLGFTVSIEKNAGKQASFSNENYEQAGASISTKKDIWNSDIILKVNAPTDSEIDLIKEGATLISFIWPAQHPELLEKLKTKKINLLAMDCVPRISRAQSLDALSSMANIAGYRAVIEAAHQFGRFFTGQITAAGKVPPAKVLVVGAGVAGLAAIGAAGSLGAIVRAFDVRPEVKEQIESMGAEFLEVDFKQEDKGPGDGYAKEMSDDFNKAAARLYAQQAKEVDIIITTALIPGKPAPRLITEEMIDNMKEGSVIVDLAAANGGNCEEGEITWPAPPIQVSAAPKAKSEPVKEASIEPQTPKSPVKKYVGAVIAALCFAWIANLAPIEFLSHFTVFILSCVVGYYVVWNVTHSLHTPLMSVTNAISGIIIVGALLQIGQGHGAVSVLAFFAILIVSINIFGGFAVTKRMLQMFHKDKE